MAIKSAFSSMRLIRRFLQVYVFELKSVTVADIKAISRAFRDRAGNYLFVVTADYEHIEFVLLDRIGESRSPTAISTAPPTLVQRRFSVDRRRPTQVHLRVIRRLTWTDVDPFGQFDKLRFAYDLAHWSEVTSTTEVCSRTIICASVFRRVYDDQLKAPPLHISGVGGTQSHALVNEYYLSANLLNVPH